MITFNTCFKRYTWVFILLVCITGMPCIVFAIEPITTIGNALPQKQVFLNDETILRVNWTNIQIVDVATNTVMDEFGEKEYYDDVVFSSDAEHLAILRFNSDSRITTVTIWSVNDKKLVAQWKIASRIDENDAAFSPTQPILATYSPDEIHLWNWENGESIGKMERVNFPSFVSMKFTRDGKHLIIASRYEIEIWNIESRLLEATFPDLGFDKLESIAVSPNNKYVAAHRRNTAFFYIWDVETRQQLWRDKSGIGRIANMVFSSDSQSLYVATRTAGLSRKGAVPYTGWDDTVRIWDIQSGKQIDSFGTEFNFLESMTLSPNEKTALLEYWDVDVVYDIEKKETKHVWADYVSSRFTNDVVMSSDGNSLASISLTTLKTWDTTSQQMLTTDTSDGYIFSGLAISPDNQNIAIGKNLRVELRDIRSGRVTSRFPHYLSDVDSISFSPSGRWLAVVNDWGDLIILDSKRTDRIQRLNRKLDLQTPNYHSIAFSNNEEYLAASGTTAENNITKYWIVIWKRIKDIYRFQYEMSTQKLADNLTFTNIKDGSLVLATSIDKEVHVMKVFLNSLRLLTTVDGEYPLGFYDNGRYLFVNNRDHSQIWDWQKGKSIKHAQLPKVSSISDDCSVIGSYNANGQFSIWNTSNVLSLLPYSVEPNGKQFVTLGQIKRNQLLQNFPNPFNPETWIPFKLADESTVTINIHNSVGELVRSISTGTMRAGDYSSQPQALHWNGKNHDGESVSSGVYFYTINAGEYSATRKMIIKK